MENAYYRLMVPELALEQEAAIYGQAATWEESVKWAKAEWVHDKMDLEQITCPVHPGHMRGGDRIGDLIVELSSPKIGDFVWTWYSECLITQRVLDLFRQAGLTGFEVRPVTVERVKRVRKSGDLRLPTLWELVVVGKGGYAHPSAGIRRIYRCEACGFEKHFSYRNGIIVDEAQWDGSDFFIVNPYGGHIVITERAKEVIASNDLYNCTIVPTHRLQWPKGLPRDEDYYDEHGRIPGR
ncbi:MAG: double-CXXCG motif protein [Thermaerobacter sp.]|nr:double-CXXCG motif protein [Thermaerobacter sp.]